MDDLRLILIVLGILLVGGIYFIGRRRSQGGDPTAEGLTQEDDLAWMEQVAQRRREAAQQREAQPPPKQEPQIEPALDDDAAVLPDAIDELEETARALDEVLEPVSEPDIAIEEEVLDIAAAEPEEQVVPSEQELIIALYLTPRDGAGFDGEPLLNALEAEGLVFGDMGIFHYYKDPDKPNGLPLFSIANMMEPGTFDPEQMLEEFTSPGLALFMRLPGPEQGTMMFEKLLASARRLAQVMGAELRDESHSTLGQQTIGHIREQVKAYDFKKQVEQRHD